MADMERCVKVVLNSLDKQARRDYDELVRELVPMTAESISNQRYWIYRQKSKTFTSADSSIGIYEMPAKCALISDTGACLVNSSNMPLSNPVIKYLSEKEFNERYPNISSSSGDPVYIIPLELSHEGKIRFRLWPDIGSSDTLKVWWLTEATSTDIQFMTPLTVILECLSNLPSKVFPFATQYIQKAQNSLNKDIIADARMAAEHLTFRQSRRTREHHDYIRQIQGG